MVNASPLKKQKSLKSADLIKNCDGFEKFRIRIFKMI